MMPIILTINFRRTRPQIPRDEKVMQDGVLEVAWTHIRHRGSFGGTDTKSMLILSAGQYSAEDMAIDAFPDGIAGYMFFESDGHSLRKTQQGEQIQSH
jgi:hypothetical protein